MLDWRDAGSDLETATTLRCAAAVSASRLRESSACVLFGGVDEYDGTCSPEFPADFGPQGRRDDRSSDQSADRSGRAE